jgi:hypothetical protein
VGAIVGCFEILGNSDGTLLGYIVGCNDGCDVGFDEG